MRSTSILRRAQGSHVHSALLGARSSSTDGEGKGAAARRRLTSFVIAHRLSTILAADKIMVLEAGVVTALGKHKELLKNRDGLYARMFRQQFAVALID